jgi:hypothetical protein
VETPLSSAAGPAIVTRHRYGKYPDEGHGFTKAHNEATAMGDIAEFLIAHLGRRE